MKNRINSKISSIKAGIIKDFPLLRRKIKGKRIVYLDSTATSLKPTQVLKALDSYNRNYSANIFRGLYRISEEATEKYLAARKDVARFIGGREDETVFVRNTTEAINLVRYSFADKFLRKGDFLLTTIMEHHANFIPWQECAKRKGLNLKITGLTKEGKLDLEDFEKKLTPGVKFVAFSHISNVLGVVNPVKDMIKMVRRISPAAKILVDGAQSVPHMKINVRDLDCDFFAFSGHKMLGPTGIGVLWGKLALLKEMDPFLYGGEMIQAVYQDRSLYKEPPDKFEAGTPAIAEAIALGEAVKYLEKIGPENIRNHEKDLTEYTMQKMMQIKGMEIVGPLNPNDRAGIIAFRIQGIHPHDIAQALDTDNVCVRSGHHCAMPLHEYLKLNATARVSFYIYNTRKDADIFISSLKKGVKFFHG